ncbi:hypothetical protein BCV70DRAFT_124232 [Testicularia cyperi]|uniref:Uncharacterized protein n=1 Tax=Testicularia cyperi TaxID=1882483 RepID=A0A317XMS1_9BASI|nr:hypothetical protein BCV70DRAFT_124232 [Testicularia cyperi]
MMRVGGWIGGPRSSPLARKVPGVTETNSEEKGDVCGWNFGRRARLAGMPRPSIRSAVHPRCQPSGHPNRTALLEQDPPCITRTHTHTHTHAQLCTTFGGYCYTHCPLSDRYTILPSATRPRSTQSYTNNFCAEPIFHLHLHSNLSTPISAALRGNHQTYLELTSHWHPIF